MQKDSVLLKEAGVGLMPNHINNVPFIFLKGHLGFLGSFKAMELNQALGPTHCQLIISQWLNGSLKRNNIRDKFKLMGSGSTPVWSRILSWSVRTKGSTRWTCLMGMANSVLCKRLTVGSYMSKSDLRSLVPAMAAHEDALWDFK